MGEPQQPLLRVEGTLSARRIRALRVLTMLAVLGVGVWLALANTGRIPWMPAFGLSRQTAGGIVRIVFYAAIFGVPFAVHVYVRPRSGDVVFYDDRIVFTKPHRRNDKKRETAVLIWPDVAAFKDDSSDFVLLLKKGERLGSRLYTIPTPSEVERTAVLALLDERGVPRAD